MPYVERTSVRPVLNLAVLPSVYYLPATQPFIRFSWHSVEELFTESYRQVCFRQNTLSDRHSLLKGVSYSCFPYFLKDLDNIRDITSLMSLTYCFTEVDVVKATLYLTVQMKLLPIFYTLHPIRKIIRYKNFHKKLLNLFRVNQRKESHTSPDVCLNYLFYLPHFTAWFW
jgi:hypothetical protein